jgi:lipoyl-dependent peroxiredoxin
MADPLYTAHARVVGGREGGRACTADGRLDLQIEPPPELGGSGDGTNPEQLFAAGYGACFLSAVKLVAGKRGVPAEESTVEAEVGLLRDGRAFTLAVALQVRMPGVEREQAERLVERAHEVCPYSNATRGNVAVEVTVAS